MSEVGVEQAQIMESLRSHITVMLINSNSRSGKAMVTMAVNIIENLSYAKHCSKYYLI